MSRRDDQEVHVMSGCKGVLAATLLRALADVREGNGEAQRAAAWIDSDRDDHLFSFQRICESLDLSPEEVRRAARSRTHRHQ